MTEISFSNVVIVAAVAFAAPLALGLIPKLRLSAIVLEIVLGIAIGPSGLGWVTSDLPVQVLSLVGLAFLLFLAGLDVELGRLRGRLLRLAGLGFVLSLGLALAIGYALEAAGQVRSPLFVGIVLSATALGLVAPVLMDADESEGEFGQLVLAAATIADFGTVILLSLLFSRNAGSVGSRLALLGSFGTLVAAVGFGVARAGRSKLLSGVLGRLGDTTAQIRVRGAVLLLLGFVALAERFGLETILGAFMAGVILRIVDPEATATHPHFRLKLEGIGYGFLIPVFFVSSGVEFNLSALLSSASTIVRVAIFLLALLLVRGIPALLYRHVLGNRRTVAAGLLQATSLSFVVAAVQIGTLLGVISAATGAALIGAGLLSVMLFPLVALLLLGDRKQSETDSNDDTRGVKRAGSSIWMPSPKFDMAPKPRPWDTKGKSMENEQRYAAKRHLIALMQAGHAWQEAAATAGVQIGRAAAYRLLKQVRTKGESALQEGRHGHPVKLREPVRKWLETTCHATPEMPSRLVQAALQERFGILVSIGHLNRVRAKLGVGSRAASREKNCVSLVQQMKPTGKRELADCCS